MTARDRVGPRRPLSLRYGIEAPYVPAALTAGGLALVVSAGLSGEWGLLIAGVVVLLQAAVFLHATIRGKVRTWERELDRLDLRGDEQVLDLGCGRGAVLIAAAQRLPRGRAVGVDLWRSRDQSGNSVEVARANAAAAGVADRVELHTADMTRLPFPNGSFDVVTSALAVHNIPTPHGRQQALDEAVRVLRPGGRLLVADFRHAARYRDHLGPGATSRNLGPSYWYGGPWAATTHDQHEQGVSRIDQFTRAVVRVGRWESVAW